MKRLIFYNILIIIGFSYGCNKVELEPIDGVPVFSASAKFDGQAKSWKAGVDDYYMFTSYEKDELDVYIFTGKLAKKDSTIGESLTIKIRDFTQFVTGPLEINASLNPNNIYGYYNFEGNTIIVDTLIDTIGWSVSFDASSSIIFPNLGATYKWDFGDSNEDSVSVSQINHVYDSTFANPTVKLTVQSNANNAYGSIERQIGLNQNTPACDIGFFLDYEPSDPVTELYAQPIGIQPFTYIWNNDSTGNFIVLDTSLSNVYASVTITDVTGCTASAEMSTTINSGAIPPISFAKFNYSITPETTPVYDTTIILNNGLQLSKVIIEYERDGVIYSSDKFTQSPDSYFKIIDVSTYDDNEKGDKTKKITIEYLCRLWNDLGDFIEVTEGKATIAVAYPD